MAIYILIPEHTLEILIAWRRDIVVPSHAPSLELALPQVLKVRCYAPPQALPWDTGNFKTGFLLMAASRHNSLGSLASISDQKNIKTPQGN